MKFLKKLQLDYPNRLPKKTSCSFQLISVLNSVKLFQVSKKRTGLLKKKHFNCSSKSDSVCDRNKFSSASKPSIITFNYFKLFQSLNRIATS